MKNLMKNPPSYALSMAVVLCSLVAPISALALSTGDPLALQLQALEGARAERQMCALVSPELKDKNEAAFQASPYARWTGEELIKAMTTGEDQAKQLAGLPTLRANFQRSSAEIPADARRRLCASMAAYLGELTIKGVRLGPKP